jgi:hypothetical protein
MAVSFSSSRQEATLLRGGRQTDKQFEERSLLLLPSAFNSSSRQTDQQMEKWSRQTNQQIEERSSSPPAADSSPPRQIAAATPPKVVTAPSNLFNSNKPADIFISPHILKKKWDPIANGMLNTRHRWTTRTSRT